MRNQTQRRKSATNKHQKYRKQLRQKKYDNQKWVLRNVPEHKIYKRNGKQCTRRMAAMQN